MKRFLRLPEILAKDALLSRMAISMLFLICVFGTNAKKIDDTHYQYCVMDDDAITDIKFNYAYDSGIVSDILGDKWTSRNGVYIDGTKTTIGGPQIVLHSGVYVLMTTPYNGSGYSLYHSWKQGNGSGIAVSASSYFYIIVDAPSGVKLSNAEPKMVIGDEIQLEKSLTGTFTPFGQHGYFDYEWISSDPNVVTVSNGKVKAVAPGKATIKINAYAKNSVYSGSYYIGDDSYEVEVFDNIDPTDISISPNELYVRVGTTKTLPTVTLTPNDARTTITWTSSDTSIASIEPSGSDYVIKGKNKGNVVLTATTSNGLEAKCYVTVLSKDDYKQVQIGDLFYDIAPGVLLAEVVPKLDKDGEPIFNYISGNIVVPSEIEVYGGRYKVFRLYDHAFYGCDIQSISLPNTIVGIKQKAFLLSKISYLDLPSSVHYISDFAFAGSQIESLILGENINDIGIGAFADCDCLKAIYVDENNTYFKEHNRCLYDYSLTKLLWIPYDASSIDFSDSIETIASYAFAGNDNIETLSFPETLISIDDFAFNACEKLSLLQFPNSLMEIGEKAFYQCNNLKEIHLGSKIKIIGSGAFANQSLSLIIIDALIPPSIEDDTFANYDATLLVPIGRTSNYKSHPKWGKFAHITDDPQEAGVEEVVTDVNDHGTFYNLHGIPVDSSYHGVVISAKGEKKIQ